MASNRSNMWESPRKIELTSLIDVIFLLLIFFLVTMRIIPSTSGMGLKEGVYSIRALQPTERSQAAALIALKRVQDSPGGWRTYYVLIKSQRGNGAWTQNQLWNSIRSASTRAHLDLLRTNAPLRVSFSSDPWALQSALQSVSEVIITTGTDNGYEFKFEEVNNLIRLFKRPESRVDHWYISPLGASQYPFGQQGVSFPALPVRRVFE